MGGGSLRVISISKRKDRENSWRELCPSGPSITKGKASLAQMWAPTVKLSLHNDPMHECLLMTWSWVWKFHLIVISPLMSQECRWAQTHAGCTVPWFMVLTFEASPLLLGSGVPCPRRQVPYFSYCLSVVWSVPPSFYLSHLTSWGITVHITLPPLAKQKNV